MESKGWNPILRWNESGIQGGGIQNLMWNQNGILGKSGIDMERNRRGAPEIFLFVFKCKNFVPVFECKKFLLVF